MTSPSSSDSVSESSPATGPTDSDEAASRRFYDLVREEYRCWQDTVPLEAGPTAAAAKRRLFPRPDQPGGLPLGWQPVSCHVEVGRQAQVGWFLTHRDTGGWVLLVHKDDAASTSLADAKEHLSALYTEYADTLAAEGTSGMRLVAETTRWFQGVLGSLYDPTDPAEAAEQVLLALTGRVRTPPRADA